jgi:hypothetical protein
LDTATTAIWVVSFYLIILGILIQTMVYASSLHRNLDSQTFIFSLMVSTSVSNIPKLQTYLRTQHDTSVYYPLKLYGDIKMFMLAAVQ